MPDPELTTASLLDLTTLQWLLAAVAALGIGVSKSGFAGVGLFHVVVFANLFGARESTGIVLPMLIVGDVAAVLGFRQHARWDYVWRMLPPTLVGIVLGRLLIGQLNDVTYRHVIGANILCLTILQLLRMYRTDLFTEVPHARWFIWSLGLFAGFTTMLANAAGPIIALYLLAVALPKYEFVGTGAWFFLIVNVFKIPFSTSLGLIRPDTLLLNAILAPMTILGLLGGRWLVKRVPQKIFDSLLLIFAALAAARMLGVFG